MSGASEPSSGIETRPGTSADALEQPIGRLLLVVNRRAGDGAASLARVAETLTRSGAPPTVVEMHDRRTLAEQLGAAFADGDVSSVVVAGGDGTINAALPALIAAGKPLGIVPLGTANDLARTLGIPDDPVAAAEIIARGRTRRIDVGQVNGRLFLNAAGIGFSAELQHMSKRLKSWLGPLAYPVGVLQRWRRQRPFRVIIRGSSFAHAHRVIQVTVANGRFYGGGMTIHEDAQIDDGTLDVLVILRRPLWRLALSALSLKRGVYSERAPIIALRGADFEVITRRHRSVATDGEISTSTPASFRVAPRALEVFTPDETPAAK